MDIQLRMAYEDETIARAINVWNEIENYNLWKTKIFTYNYLLTYYDIARLRYYRELPSKQQILLKCESLIFNTLIRDYENNQQEMNELMDIIIRFTGSEDIVDRIQNRILEIEAERLVGQTTRMEILNTERTVYQDKQNVHNRAINNSVKQAAIYLYNMNKNLACMIQDSDLLVQLTKGLGITDQKIIDDIYTMIYEYSSQFGIGITVNQVLKGLWCLILDRTNINIQNDLKKRLKEELIEMNGQCTSGHLSRLINVVQGFHQITDKHPQLLIKISDEEQIKAVIFNKLNNFIRDNDLIDYLDEPEKLKYQIKDFISNTDFSEYEINECFIHEIVNKYFDYNIFN